MVICYHSEVSGQGFGPAGLGECGRLVVWHFLDVIQPGLSCHLWILRIPSLPLDVTFVSIVISSMKQGDAFQAYCFLFVSISFQVAALWRALLQNPGQYLIQNLPRLLVNIVEQAVAKELGTDLSCTLFSFRVRCHIRVLHSRHALFFKLQTSFFLGRIWMAASIFLFVKQRSASRRCRPGETSSLPPRHFHVTSFVYLFSETETYMFSWS